jgi:hypothetical protein
VRLLLLPDLQVRLVQLDQRVLVLLCLALQVRQARLVLLASMALQVRQARLVLLASMALPARLDPQERLELVDQQAQQDLPALGLIPAPALQPPLVRQHLPPATQLAMLKSS